MNNCYCGCIAKITGSDIIDFMGDFIKGLKGDIGMTYAKDDETGEVDAMLAIQYRANSSGNTNNYNNNNKLLPIPGLGGGNNNINKSVLDSLNRIRLVAFKPTLLTRDDAIVFRIDFAALVAEMLNPAKGFQVSIDQIKVLGKSDVVIIASVFRSNKNVNENKMTRVLQHQKFDRRRERPQLYRR